MSRQRMAVGLVRMARELIGTPKKRTASWISVIARVIDKQAGFLTDKDTPVLKKVMPWMAVLVRCGRSRYVAPIRDLDKVFQIVEEEGDYVRDVSIPAKSVERFMKGGELLKLGRITKH